LSNDSGNNLFNAVSAEHSDSFLKRMWVPILIVFVALGLSFGIWRIVGLKMNYGLHSGMRDEDVMKVLGTPSCRSSGTVICGFASRPAQIENFNPSATFSLSGNKWLVIEYDSHYVIKRWAVVRPTSLYQSAPGQTPCGDASLAAPALVAQESHEEYSRCGVSQTKYTDYTDGFELLDSKSY
jgi:hypothetical protein